MLFVADMKYNISTFYLFKIAVLEILLTVTYNQ